MIDHLAQTFDTRGQRFLSVLIKKELGVGQARAHHALVAANHQAWVIRGDIADHQELVGQLAGGVQQRKVLLVGLHREDEAFLRHTEKLLLERAHQHIGALHQRGHFVEQGVVVNGMGAVAHFCGRSSQLARDLGAALGEAGNDGAFIAQLLGITVRILEHYGGDLGLKPVALRAVARLKPQRLDWHHVAAVQRDQPVGGAYELHAAPTGEFAVGLQLVGHHLGDGELGDGFVQRLLQALNQRSPSY